MEQSATAIPADEIASVHRAVLDRVASSKTLQRSARLRELLLDIREHTLAGEPQKLTEQAIGVRIFGRAPSYNPADDNIVRSSVRQLRLKLKEYFENEGANEAWVVEIPKGNYCAAFTQRSVGTVVPLHLGSRPQRALTIVLAGLCAVLTIACAALWTQKRPTPAEEPDTVFGSLFAQGSGPIRFIFTDSVTVVVGPFFGPPSLERYVDQSYLEDVLRLFPAGDGRRLYDLLRDRQITSFADVEILAKVLQTYPSAGRRIELRHAKFVSTRDFKTDNFVILGSFTANPWNYLFDAQLQFAIDPGKGIRNLSPQAGEPAYWPAVETTGIAPARIALLHNLSGAGFVLTISGVSMEATEGAGEFMLRTDSLNLVSRALGLRAEERLPTFEIVLETSALQGTARSARILAVRRH